MKKELLEFCRSINIEYVGIVSAEPFYDFEELWKKKIIKGHISGFEEKDIEKRIYPDRTLEDAKSIITCLFPYYTGINNNGNLSKYAYSLDYHIIAKKKLESIGQFLRDNIEGFNYKVFVDTGPFSDRYLAHKSGIGFFGINNHIITDKYGSYVFIGYIINNYLFEPDKPQERTCYQCFNCVRKCPGNCILGDFTINPLKCKSFITQKKGELSEEEIDILTKSSLIWGCDICQDVCPHNRNVQSTIIEKFTRNLKFSLDYEEISKISNKEFIRRYGDRAFSWRGKGVLLRNYELVSSNYEGNNLL